MKLLRRFIPLLIVGVMVLGAAVALADSHPSEGDDNTPSDGGITDGDGEDGGATEVTLSAHNNATSTRRALVGTVSGFATSTVATTTVIVTVTKQGTGELVELTLDGSEIIKTPGGPRAGTFDVTARVVIKTKWVNGELVVDRVLVKPVKPPLPLVATVVDVEDGVLTLLLPNGKTKIIKGPKGADAPDVGEVVTAFVGPSQDSDGGEDGDQPPEYTGLVTASKVHDRLQRFIEKLAAKEDKLPEAALAARARLVANLAAVLEDYDSELVDLIQNQGQGEGLSPSAARGLEKALEKARRGRAHGQDCYCRCPLQGRTSSRPG